MRELALVGKTLIHTYVYLANFNRCELETLKKNGRDWQVALMKDKDLTPIMGDLSVTRIWGGEPEEVRKNAETFGIRKVCATPEEAIAGAFGALVMDEDPDSRAELVAKCLRAGLHVYCDKMVSMDPRRTEELLAEADSRGLALRSWSHMYFSQAFKPVLALPRGGVGYMSCRMGMNILVQYAIHPISALQGAFRSKVALCRPLRDGDQRALFIELDGGTRLFVYIGLDAPFFLKLTYAHQGKVAAADPPNEYDIFQRAARAIGDAFDGKPPADAPGPAQMREAVRLQGVLARGGSDGREVRLEA